MSNIMLAFVATFVKTWTGGRRKRRAGRPHARRRQVLSGPFPPLLHRKIRKYVKYSRIFLFCLSEKFLAQNCFARKKRGFCVGQGEKRRNPGYGFRALLFGYLQFNPGSCRPGRWSPPARAGTCRCCGWPSPRPAGGRRSRAPPSGRWSRSSRRYPG